MRGIFKGIFNNNKCKVWHINLLESKPVWYEDIFGEVYPNIDIDYRKKVKKDLLDMKKQHQEYFNRRYIYFLCTRKKVRFLSAKYIRLPIVKNYILVHLAIGMDEKKISVKIPISTLNNLKIDAQSLLEEVTTTPTSITFIFENNHLYVSSIHNFLRDFNIKLKIPTKIHYIGYTKVPEQRPFRGRHEGLTRTLYKTRDSKTDVFTYYNTFVVRAKWENDESKMDFIVSNAMSDMINIKDEGLLIEKALIWYFSPDAQGDIRSETTSLRRLLSKAQKEHNISKVQFDFKTRGFDEYFSFCSNSVKPSQTHCFTISSKTI